MHCLADDWVKVVCLVWKVALANQSLRLRCLDRDVHLHGIHQHHDWIGARCGAQLRAGDCPDSARTRPSFNARRQYRNLQPLETTHVDLDAKRCRRLQVEYIITSVEERSNIFTFVCLSVCFSVNKISHNVVNGFS